MANWKVRVKGLRKLLTTDETDEEAVRASKEIYKILTSKTYNKYFLEFDRLEDFDGYIETLEEFNDLLDDMYDYCDSKRIWIEF